MPEYKIYWICELPTHYNDFLFNGLARDKEVELFVYYMNSSLSSHPWKISNEKLYAHRPFHIRLRVDWGILKNAFKREAFFIIGGWFNLTAIGVISIRLLLGYPYFIWTDSPNILKKRSKVFSYLRGKWINIVFKHAKFIMGTGKMALDNLLLIGAPAKRTKNFPYLTDNSIFYPVEGCSTKKKFTFLSSGRLVNAHKGYDVALQAFAQAVRAFPNLPLTYLIAGVGPDLGNLRQLALDLGIDDRVTFLGWLDPQELPGFYQSGSFFLHPAVFEPYGVSVLEAMASGNIVIGSENTGAVVDRVIDGENGFIHETGNESQLAAIIIKLLANEDLMDTLKLAARNTASEWSLDRAIIDLKKLMKICVES